MVEHLLAKQKVEGSNPFFRSIIFGGGGVAKWLRQRSAKPLFAGSIPAAASSLMCRRPAEWVGDFRIRR